MAALAQGGTEVLELLSPGLMTSCRHSGPKGEGCMGNTAIRDRQRARSIGSVVERRHRRTSLGTSQASSLSRRASTNNEHLFEDTPTHCLIPGMD